MKMDSKSFKITQIRRSVLIFYFGYIQKIINILIKINNLNKLKIFKLYKTRQANNFKIY